MIEVRNLIKTYLSGGRKIAAVESVSFSIAKGDMVSVAGHSGSGKTTLMSLIGGLTRPDSGSVMIGGLDLWAMDDKGLSSFRNRKIGFIYQFSSLIPTLTALENILLPTAFSQGNADARGYAKELLSVVGLEDRAYAYPSQLSGGQQRRVAIARAFINNPEIILADEPTGDLDEETEAEMMGLFIKMNTEREITFLLVTHSSEIAARTGRRFRMSSGKLSEAGEASSSQEVS